MDTQFKKERKATKNVLVFMALPIFTQLLQNLIFILGGYYKILSNSKTYSLLKSVFQYNPTKSHQHNENGHC